MSGTSRIIAHEVQILADSAIVGPTPDSRLLSSPSNTLLGYNPTSIEGLAGLAAPIAPGGTTILDISPPSTSPPYFGATTTCYKSIGNVQVAANQLQVTGVTSLRGVVTLSFGGITNIVPAFPPELIALNLVVSDDTGFTHTETYVTPVVSPSPTANWIYASYPFIFVNDNTRSRVNFQFTVTNLQAVGTISPNLRYKVVIDQ